MATTKDAKLLRSTKFPIEFNQKVDMKKVNVEVMKKWIAGKISEILGNEDDVVIELCFNLLEESRFPDIKDLQIKLTGFLDKDTPVFCKELWSLCLSAQSNPQGVPKELLEAKKMELMQEKLESEKAAQVARQRKETDQNRERNLDNIRQRERFERGRGGGNGPSRGGGYDRRGPTRDDSRSPPSRNYRRYSRSPSRRRGSPGRDRDGDSYRNNQRRDRDIYIPRGRSDRYEDRRRRRSPSPDRDRDRNRDRASPPPKRRRNSSSSSSPPRIRTAAATANGRTRKDSTSPAGRPRSRSRSRSRSPPVRSARRRGASPSLSRSRSRSTSPAPRTRRKRSPSSDASVVASRSRSRTRSRSGSRSPVTKKVIRQSRGSDRSRRSPSHSRSRSRTPVREERSRKQRHRSLERYAPAGTRKRRNSSSSLSGREEKTARVEPAEDDEKMDGD